MRVLKSVQKNGKFIVTVETDAGETLRGFRDDSFYRTGGPHEQIVSGDVISGAEAVTWCPVEQKWVS